VCQRVFGNPCQNGRRKSLINVYIEIQARQQAAASSLG
jgi:hypothetical protein